MNDRELLELAAKAVGFEAEYVEAAQREEGDGRYEYEFTGMVVTENGFYSRDWNPLTDDGDALRLAVELHMEVTVYPTCTDAQAYGKNVVREVGEEDDCATTRRAIVRAAAEIGKAMP